MKRHGLWRWHRTLNDVRVNQPNLWEFRGQPRWWVEEDLESACACIDRSRTTYSSTKVISRCVFRFMRRYKIKQTIKNWNDLVETVASRMAAHTFSFNRLLIRRERETKPFKFYRDEMDVYVYYIPSDSVRYRFNAYKKKCDEDRTKIAHAYRNHWYGGFQMYEQLKKDYPGIPILEANKKFCERQNLHMKILNEKHELKQCRSILRQLQRTLNENSKNNRPVA